MLPFIAAYALGAGIQQKAAPAPDRSAESALKQLFSAAGAMRNVHLSTTSYYYDEEADRWAPSSFVDLWLGEGGRFRMENTDLYGGAGRFVVSDGLSVLTDELNDDSPITISKATNKLETIDKNDVIFYLFEGQDGFNDLVEKDKDVKMVAAGNGEKAIEFHVKDLGKMVVTYREGAPMPQTIEGFRPPWWSDDPKVDSDKPSFKEDVRLVGYGPFSSQLFVVSAPKGQKVTDERTKK